MKIGLDASFAINDESGVGRYSFNLIKNLLAIDRKNQYILFFNYFRNRVEKDKKINELVGDNKNVKIIKNHLLGKIKDKIWENPLIYPINLYFGQLDLYHATCFQAYPKKIIATKSIVTIHDLTYLVDQNFHQNLSKYYQKITANAVKKADLIIADSNSTKNDLIKYFPIKSDQIKTVYPGVDDKFKPANKGDILEFKNKYTSGSEYILSVGTLEPRKNLSRLIEAYQKLPMALQNQYKLLIIGRSGWGKQENVECTHSTLQQVQSGEQGRTTSSGQEMQNAELKKNNIIFTGFLSDDELVKAYSGASLFIYPSLYEGFGFPPLEAMACGVPVITSDVSSLPEVVGDGAILVNPYDVDEISKTIQKVLLNSSLQKELIQNSKKNIKKFSWFKTANVTLELYNKIL